MAKNTEDEVIHVKIDHPRMTIEGYPLNNVETDKKNREKFVFFLGIPYAKSPLEKEKRFEPPEPYVYDPEKDGNPFQANKGFKTALQLDLNKTEKEETQELENQEPEIQDSEKEKDEPLDCLYLNIYVPKRPQEISDPLAVMVYFHGGGFYQGSGNYDEKTPESIVRHGVILVTVNYRLGPFGFLNMHAEQCKGNAGLKDQVMALKWVRDNIRKFGGDPNNVTIWGESAGGSCVNFHLISPLSKGLFHKAIIQSGGIYCPWGFTGDQREMKAKWEKYKSILEVKQGMVVEMLNEANSADILWLHWEIVDLDRETGRVDVDVGPSIESFMTTDAFLPYGVKELIKDANPVPILAGITALDGYSLSNLGVPFDHPVDWILDDKKFCDFLAANLHWEKSVAKKYFHEIRKEYFDLMELRGSHINKTRESSSDNMAEKAEAEENRIFNAEERLARMCTDLWFYHFYDGLKLGGGLKSSAPMYIYEFDLVSRINPSRGYRDKMTGATHGDDIAYLLPNAHHRSKLMPYSDDEQKKITTMCSLWTSFCKTGTPKSMHHDVEWLPHTEEEPRYLNIGEDLVLKNGRLNERRWNILKAINQEDEQIKARTSDPSKWNTRASFRMTLEEYREISSKLSLDSKLEFSTEKIKSFPEMPKILVHSEGGEEGECSTRRKSCPGTLETSEDVQGEERPTSLTLQIPSANGLKRHSPSRSPTSKNKTSKDESSEAKKGRTADDDESEPQSPSKSSNLLTKTPQNES